MDRLRRTRGVVRSAVTRTISQLDGLIQNPNTTELDLRLPLDYLIQKQTSLADLDRDILTSTTDDDLENEIEGAEDYRTGISHGITRLRYALDKLSQPTIIATRAASTPTDTLQHSGHPPTTETLSSLPPTGTVLTAPAHGSHRRVALPKLQVNLLYTKNLCVALFDVQCDDTDDCVGGKYQRVEAVKNVTDKAFYTKARRRQAAPVLDLTEIN
ncbi:hypothetical protein HPB47_014389 [Ixodes persulcatus]|uniref:Uncharacterized protein n=1 Tax=Ixodes persulcatus TaxID=34615 RepID=A0AC60QXH1_IXOPE|nr:hypothetical protein HPB47_014389 [Ixodes persulcatus]